MAPSPSSSVLTVDMLERTTRRFASVLERTGMDLPVPSCPQWVVEDLARHLGGIHLWAAGAVRDGTSMDVTAAEDVITEELPLWYRQVASDLVTLLDRVGPEAPSWVFAPTPGIGPASFWLRRQIHETVMHTWDLSAASGIIEQLDADLAWDGVEEVRDVFYPRQLARGRLAPLPAALHLEALDLGRPPVVIGCGEPVWVRHRACDILLMLWHRSTPPTDVAAAALLSLPLTP